MDDGAVGGTMSYLASDSLGSVSTAFDGRGNVIAAQLYAPYGSVRYSSGTMPTSKGFTGQRSDVATSGLDYYNTRYYDPVLGQFASADTLQGPNRYAYMSDDPETLTDPTGHIRCLDPPCDGSGRNYGSGSGGASGGGCRTDASCGCYSSCGTPPSSSPPITCGTSCHQQSGDHSHRCASCGRNATSDGAQHANSLLLQEFSSMGLGSKGLRLLQALKNTNIADLEQLFKDLVAKLLGDGGTIGAGDGALGRILGWLEGNAVLVGVAFFADAARYALTFFQGSSRSDLQGLDRGVTALLAGVIHATIVTASAVGAGAGAIATTGIPVLAWGAAVIGGALGGYLANWVTPGLIDALVPAPTQNTSSPSFDIPAMGGL